MAEPKERDEQKSAEWAESFYRAILDSALDCIITMDSGGRILEFNPAAERVFGFTRSEAVGQELASLIIPPGLRDQHRHGLAHYLKTGEGPVLGRRIEINGLRRDGSEILVELAITALKIEGGPVFTAYLRDITERVRNDRRRTAQYGVANLLAGSWTLEEACPPILEVVAAIDDWAIAGIWLCDEENQTMRCQFVWQGKGETAGTFGEVSRATPLKKGEGLPGRVWESREPTWIHDVTIERNFPRTRAAAEVNLRGGFAFPLFVGNTVNGVIEMFSHQVAHPDADLLQLVKALGSQIGLFIERGRIQEELQRQRDRAEAANAAKDRFLATLSHELRTPLTPVMIWAGGMLGQPGLSEEIEEGLRMVMRNVELEARLIDDLLDLTRVSRGKLQLQLQAADAHELLGHALEIVRNDIEDRHLTMQVDLAATLHEVEVDSPRIQQVFWNVLRNACKFTPRQGTVSVRTYNRTMDAVTIEISDNGMGIESNFLERIFDAFEQGDSRREGLGLGLAISKAIIEMHGGRIQAVSEGAGKGATFIIDLPLHRAKESA